jgi:dihydroorotase
MLGLETALGVALAELHHAGPAMPIVEVVGALSWRPARIAGVADRHGGPIEPGRPANIAVFDPAARWQVQPATLASRSRNTPFVGLPLVGRVRHTLLRGDVVVESGVAKR